MAFRRAIPENEALRRFGGELLPATLGAAVAAAAQDPRLSPTDLAGTQSEIMRERGQLPGEEEFFMVGPGGVIGREQPVGEFVDRPDLSPLVEPDALNEEFGHLGLKFDQPERRAVAEILAKQKQEDLIRQDILARAPGGVGATAAILGGSFLRAAMDPLNIASAFVPVVSQARFAGWLARAGPTGARLARGTIEGVVGNALIEPAVFGLSRSQQLDYTMADALVNIGLGGLLGGGLHVAGGRIADAVSRVSPEAREAALRTSVAQLVEGRDVDLRAVLLANATRRERLSTTTSLVSPSPVIRVLPSPTEQPFVMPQPRAAVPLVTRDGEPRVFPTQREAVRAVGKLRGEVDVVETKTGTFQLVRQRENIEIVRGTDGEVRTFKTRRAAEKAIAREQGLDPDIHKPVLFGRPGEIRHAIVSGATPDDIRGIAAVPEHFVPAARVTPTETAVQPASIRPAIMKEIISRESSPERDITADFDSSDRISELIEKQPGDIDDNAAAAELEFTEETIEAMRAANLLTEEDEAVLAEADILLQRAEQYGLAARQAAFCLGRRS